MLNRSLYRLVVVVFVVLAFPCAVFAGAYSNSVTYGGQGLINEGENGYDLVTELCTIAGGGDVDGPYLLWVLTATGAKNADITGPFGTVPMVKTGNGTFKYVSGWWAPPSLPGNVSATYDGKVKNAQLVISHGCRPFTNGAWCSPGFWGNATDGAWALAGKNRTDLFNGLVYSEWWGDGVDPLTNTVVLSNPTIFTVLTATGGLYKGAGISGWNPLTQPANGGVAMNPFNATGAMLTSNIPGYTFDPQAYINAPKDEQCPIDHFGHFKNPQQ